MRSSDQFELPLSILPNRRASRQILAFAMAKAALHSRQRLP